MIPIAGFLIAVIAGWTVRDARRAAKVVVAPWIGVLAVQTWYIAIGRGVSPPSTVTQFPDAGGYWAVQAVALALSLGIAGQLGAVRARGAFLRGESGGSGRQVAIASALSAAVSTAVIAAYLFDHALFEPGSVAHHAASGQPPVLGILGMVLSIVTVTALGVIRRRSRRTSAGAISAM